MYHDLSETAFVMFVIQRLQQVCTSGPAAANGRSFLYSELLVVNDSELCACPSGGEM